MSSSADESQPRPDDTPACREALRLRAKGLWPIPITSPFAYHAAAGKAPIGAGWGRTRHTPASLRAVYASNYDAGVGLLLGSEGGIIDIEFDGCEDSELAYAEIMGNECIETMGWSSRRGPHKLFRWDGRLTKYAKSKFIDFKYKGVEVRIGALPDEPKQVQSVCPPSLMSEKDEAGKVISLGPRIWNDVEEIATLPDAFFELADRLFEEAMRARSAGPGTTTDDRDPAVRKYVLSALDDEVHRVLTAREGDRNEQLNRSAFALGQFVGAGVLDRSMAEAMLKNAASRVRLGTEEAEATIKSGLDSGAAEPRDLSGVGAQAGAGAYVGHGASARVGPEPDPEPRTTLADMATAADLIQAQAGIEWLWEGWIQKGVLTLLAAEAGIGKTRFSLDLCRRIALGLPWPDGQPNTVPLGATTLWIPADNNHSELAENPPKFGFDPASIYLNTSKADIYGGTELSTLEQLAKFEFHIRCCKPVLVFIDTITNTSDHKSHDTSDAKKQYKPLQEIAKRTGTSIVCVTHLNAMGKTVGRRADEKVRTAIRLEKPDPDGQPNRRKLWVTKTNWVCPPPLGVTMGEAGNEYDTNPPTPPDAPAGGAFVGRPGVTVGPAKGARTDEAIAWLLDYLQDGAMRHSDILQAAKAMGFGVSTLVSAGRKAGIHEFEVEGRKWWELTAEDIDD